MSLTYDGNKIIPAPLISLNKEYHKTGDGTKLGALYKITLTGTLLPFRGSPDSTFTLNSPSGAFWQLSGEPADEVYAGNNADFANIQRKQEALRWLFSREGKNFEWQAAGGQEVVKCNPRVLSISFPEGTWADRCGYTIELETDTVHITRGAASSEDSFGYDLIQEGSEEWQFSETAGRNGDVYEVSHTVNAKGIQGYELDGQTLGDAWDKARLWCESKVTGAIPSGVMDTIVGATNWIGGSYIKNVSIGQSDGSYSVTETWSLGESNTFIEKSFSLDRQDQEDSVSVSYQGTIYGISDGERIGGPGAIVQAKAIIPTNAQAKAEAEAALAGVNLLGSNVIPATPQQKNITVSNKDGIVSFSFNWSTDEEDDYSQENDASLSYAVGDGIYVMSYTTIIEGRGDTSAERLAGAASGLPATDLAAYNLAATLLSSQIADLPVGITISTDPINRSTAVVEKRGTIRATWSWNSSAENDVDIQVENVYPADVSAKITIPGRAAGPIIQDMNTQTAQQIVVTYNSRGTLAKPDNTTVAAAMDTAGGVPANVVLDGDRETWNNTTKQYSRTRTHTVIGS